jgi:2,4-dienoyl-CoA reductase-like NADH-dependent reductase (Old Yellow Enzyme family)/thioredoxin reductase
MFARLFERGLIGGLELKNRIFKPAAQSTPCTNGYVSERLIRFYEEEARGGVGLIIVGLCRVSPHETEAPSGAIGVENDGRIYDLGALAQAIHDNGAKCCLQLAHFGSHAHPPLRCVSLEGLENDAWFHEHHPTLDYYPQQPYTIDEIHELVGFYGDAATRAVRAGFDMVEIHGGHRHGLGCFLSPLTNKRKDEYGGSFENRTKILYEIIADVRKKIGDRFPISVRLNGSDCDPNGAQIDEAIRMAKKCEELNVNAINMSNQLAVAGGMAPLATHTWAAEAVKKEVPIPVLTCGSINTPDLAEQILRDGRADFIGTGRALFADPYWPKKAKEGRPEDIVPCIRCLECVGPRFSWNGPLACSVNVAIGKEKALPLVSAEKPKRVAVIGGGVAGMEAARVLTLRGHDVTLFEKNKLGGILNEASVPEFKEDLRRLIQYYKPQMYKLNINMVYAEADVHRLENGFDAVIVATGGKPIELNIPGINGNNVHAAIDVLSQKPDIGHEIVIIGGGTVGVELALLLAKQSKVITMVEMLDDIMITENPIIKMIYMNMLHEAGVSILPGRRLESIDEKKVIIADRSGKKDYLAADDVIIAAGMKPDKILRERLEKETGLEVYSAGDCLAPRKVYDAIHEGNCCARQI